ncbi:hypothetical protein E5F05_00580 (plasmid) [Deinococcus metallilatus]|uniref:Uncharacterized protein n=1 Tax=Deinococcus metallilatus TaxID=1211322 RepID=A0AAJ5K1H8_9DEIO|nr:hypothetical protein [Deinococcus metallilatus]MBB5293399.1 hypothetical protein [Deinococcus metallilatus]QBY06493.1 hypothetical protein E5F05_00580 [Deinococcus metallilatus]RXJ17836.1 hypothetical protein ERJ73_00190 [Deinococcus metallilatus]TLK32108.1 hypothetical protein FCS05_01210 [Deinococcus metallilatus]GMA15381.1 hypothetical protein GCM10025871_17120 [Deinococcus metallilatus]
MITDLHCRLLGLVVPRPTPEPVTGVRLEPDAVRQAKGLLSPPGLAAGGPALGRREGGEVWVTHLIAGGYPWQVSGPLEMDAPYVLGAVDALNQGAEVDWVGYWVWSGRSHTDQEAFLRAAYDRGLIDEMRPLIVLGRTREQAIIRAWSGDEEGEEIPCDPSWTSPAEKQ